MKNKCVLVTGAAQGIGKSIARIALENGAEAVSLIDKNASRLNETAHELEKGGTSVATIISDLRYQKLCHAAFAEAIESMGRVDILVNNAGIYNYVPIEEIDDTEWDLVLDVCLRGLFHLSVAGVRHMRSLGAGRIINIASVDGFVAFPEMSHYAAAKAGVISLTRSFAVEYAKDNILVNAIAPGIIDTPRIRAHDRTKLVVPRIPLGRAGKPEEIAEAARYLASDANSYMTGEVMIVSGGLVIN